MCSKIERCMGAIAQATPSAQPKRSADANAGTPVRSEVVELTDADREQATDKQRHTMKSIETLAKSRGVKVNWVKSISSYDADGNYVGEANGASDRANNSITLAMDTKQTMADQMA
ncbi:MAG: hypothetical protein PHD32_11045, partial [Eubacteriales bacterium]|nr:hypothetical protein [Eubacteriales bacterium]